MYILFLEKNFTRFAFSSFFLLGPYDINCFITNQMVFFTILYDHYGQFLLFDKSFTRFVRSQIFFFAHSLLEDAKKILAQGKYFFQVFLLTNVTG